MRMLGIDTAISFDAYFGEDVIFALTIPSTMLSRLSNCYYLQNPHAPWGAHYRRNWHFADDVT